MAGGFGDPVGSKVSSFSGREKCHKMEFGPREPSGVFQGVPIKVGGENDPVPVHLEDGKDKHIVWPRRSLAKDNRSALVYFRGSGRGHGSMDQAH